ncbi:MAG: methyltransferase domain-containing protein, partial [Pseudomonadota bacterium]
MSYNKFMKADYSKIASRYDNTRTLSAQKLDPVLLHMAKASDKPAFRALDLGCGTGNYLKAQVEQGPTSVSWEGLDASPEMLDIARS